MLIEVADNGCGIAPEHLPRLFDPFFTTKDVGEGTGLGLSISHHIVAAHGGRIEVESEPGAGSWFRVYLPLNPSRGPGGACRRNTPCWSWTTSGTFAIPSTTCSATSSPCSRRRAPRRASA